MALLLGGTVLLAHHSAVQRDEAARWEMHTFEVLDATSQLRLAALYAMRGERGYLITQDSRFLEPYYESLSGIASGMARLNRLVGDNPEQLERLDTIEGRLDYMIGIMSHMIALQDAGQRDEMLSRIRAGQGRRALDRILVELDQFEHVERNLLDARRNDRMQSVEREERVDVLLGAAMLVLLLVCGLATLELRRSLSREEAARREMELRAATDELTGLANRRETLAALDRQISMTRRHRRPLSVAILDIDHFKKVNDTHGHPAGDEVIRRVAQISEEIMREEDMVGRLGGEEFVVILPETDAVAALAACDRLRSAVANTTMLLENGTKLNITLSAGVAQMVPVDDRNRLIARADEALYDAKEQGRDRVLLAA